MCIKTRYSISKIRLIGKLILLIYSLHFFVHSNAEPLTTILPSLSTNSPQIGIDISASGNNTPSLILANDGLPPAASSIIEISASESAESKKVEESVAKTLPDTPPRNPAASKEFNAKVLGATNEGVDNKGALPETPLRNYASKECNAKVLLANEGAENKGAVLNDKEKDAYMRNPCERAQNKFLIVELCENIQVKYSIRRICRN